MMLGIETLHHVSLPVTDLERAASFYEDVIGLTRISRGLESDSCAFELPGYWYRVGDRQLHLVLHKSVLRPTLRVGKDLDSYDVHFALRVQNFQQARFALKEKGYHPSSADELRRTRENPTGPAGFPQIYLMDPDRNVIELNAASLD